MKFAITTLVLGFVAAGSLAQDALPEPEYVNEAYLLNGGKLEKVEIANLRLQTKTSNYFVTVKGTTSQVVNGVQSPVRVAPDAHFIVRMHNTDTDPSTIIKLRAFKIGKGDRESVTYTISAHIYGGADSRPTEENSVPITIKKYGTQSVEVIPNAPLAPGEYFITIYPSSLQASCFGVDGK